MTIALDLPEEDEDTVIVIQPLLAEDLDSLSPEDLESIRSGLEDSKKNRVHEGESVLAELRITCGRGR